MHHYTLADQLRIDNYLSSKIQDGPYVESVVKINSDASLTSEDKKKRGTILTYYLSTLLFIVGGYVHASYIK